MLPVLIALLGSGLRMPEKLFLGWFGPRGLASVVFAVIVINEHLPGESILVLTVVCTVTLSVIAHGLSANPLARALAAYESRQPQARVVAVKLSARWYGARRSGPNTAAKHFSLHLHHPHCRIARRALRVSVFFTLCERVSQQLSK